MSRRTTHGNRLGIALVALGLLAPAGYTLLRGTGRLSGEPATEPVIPASWRALAGTEGWFWPALAVGAGLVALLALRWLLVQARTGHEWRLILDQDPYGSTTVDARALASTVADEIASLPDTRSASAAFVDGLGPPRLSIRITVDETTDLGQLQASLLDVLANVRQSLEVNTLAALIRLRVHGRRRPTRVT
jgi:hypothetical protein